MIATAALGDIVIQRRNEKQPAPAEVRHQTRAQRKFVRQLGHREAAQVAHDHQNVLVHGVDVKQVVLHLTHDAPEFRKVTAEHAILIHAAQLVHDSARLLEQ